MNVDRFNAAIQAIDDTNAQDPNQEEWRGMWYPKELLYGWRMTEWGERVAPDASECLRLAIRGQHIRRWEVPRSNYPRTREGYLRWRASLYRLHADHLAAIMRGIGYEADAIERVRRLVAKRNLRTDPEAQALEDTACLVFLAHYFEPFAAYREEEQLLGIVCKTWNKMSERGRALAIRIEWPEHLGAIVAKSLWLTCQERSGADHLCP
ncbi:MAG TPA: DUF4202 domain-containing protein [Methylococcus sp.]|nr:DUF4202 domain-containing protein [Methylococcus sp.]